MTSQDDKQLPEKKYSSPLELPPKILKPIELPESSDYFKKLGAAVNKKDLRDMAINVDENKLTKEECQGIIEVISRTHGLPVELAFAAVCLLILKGASNEGAPRTMPVEIKDGEKIVNVTKNDLIYACEVTCKHNYLRRLAETLCVEISKFAEAHNLNGDLAITLNNALLAKGCTPLTSKERAWASSFNQNLTSLVDVVGIRVPTLLAEDYQRRFPNAGKKKKQKPKKESEPPRPKRGGGPKPKGKGDQKENGKPKANGKPQGQR